MPFAPHVRKQVLAALDEYIIPALQAGPIVQILAGPPYDFSAVEHHVERKALLPHKTFSPLQMRLEWPREHMMSQQIPRLGFVYEGVSYERVGITTAARGQLPGTALAGITRLHIPAPGIVCYPPCSINNDGHSSHFRAPLLLRVLSFRITENDVRVLNIERSPGYALVTHHLQIDDALLARLGAIYLDELQQAGSGQSSQAQLLAFMCRLRRYVHEKKPGFSNSSWPDLTAITDKIQASGEVRHQELCSEVVDYIQYNMHRPLRLDEIAAHFEVSQGYLNTVFNRILGMTVMSHLTRQRIEAAREMLRLENDPISDIAQLTGFSSTSSFCTVFRRHTGMNPNQYRRHSRICKSADS